jgi:mitochondrial ribonuclease P protein 3
LKLTENEFISLQSNVQEKLIVGSDLFLKTLPGELDRFLQYVKDTAPYDIVLDALNIAYVARNGAIQRVDLLKTVVNHYVSQKKKILLLGRKHMLHWPKRQMTEILGKTCSFFIDDL